MDELLVAPDKLGDAVNQLLLLGVQAICGAVAPDAVRPVIVGPLILGSSLLCNGLQPSHVSIVLLERGDVRDQVVVAEVEELELLVALEDVKHDEELR